MRATPAELFKGRKNPIQRYRGGNKEMIRKTDIRVRGYHLDLYGHVNNARYLEFLEEARWDLFDNNLDPMALPFLRQPLEFHGFARSRTASTSGLFNHVQKILMKPGIAG